jgi:hypothetical protein
MKYQDQLQNPKWQKLRLEKMQEADWQCEICGDADTELNIHHIEYRENRRAWDYPLEELECLCRDCHIIAGLPQRKLKAWCDAKKINSKLVKIAASESEWLRRVLDRELVNLASSNPAVWEGWMDGLFSRLVDLQPPITTHEEYPMQVGIQQLCRLSLIDPDTKAWLAKQNSPRPHELGEGGDLLGKILESPLALQQPSARAAFMATLTAAEEVAVSELDLERPQENSLLVAQDLWLGLAAAICKEQRSEAAAQLHKHDLTDSERTRLQAVVAEATKEILNLQGRLNDV